MQPIDDSSVRQEVLDPAGSFIVQAPAGSGKTELLTQRILRLLAQAVEEPEQVLAITFTQKAALEMAERVYQALYNAEHLPMPEKEPARNNWLLASAVLEKDKQLQWGLLRDRQKLNIRTIDALCAELVRQSPTQISDMLHIVERPELLYRQAVYSALDRLAQDPEYQQNVQTLLHHLDNRLDQLISMLVALLARRDQWLPQWLPYWQSPETLRALLESYLSAWIRTSLQQALDRFQAVSLELPEFSVSSLRYY